MPKPDASEKDSPELIPNRIDLALTLGRLGASAFKQGRKGESEFFYNRSFLLFNEQLAFDKERFGPVDIRLLGTIRPMSQLYLMREDFNNALSAYKSELEILQQQLFGKQVDSDITRSLKIVLSNIEQVLIKMGQEQQLPVYTQAVSKALEKLSEKSQSGL